MAKRPMQYRANCSIQQFVKLALTKYILTMSISQRRNTLVVSFIFFLSKSSFAASHTPETKLLYSSATFMGRHLIDMFSNEDSSADTFAFISEASLKKLSNDD